MVRLVGYVTRHAPMPKHWLCLLIWSFCAAGICSAQQPDDLQQQLQQLKQEYQQKLQELDQRLAALEKQGTAPAPAQAAPQQNMSQSVTSALGNAVADVKDVVVNK